MNSFEGKSEAYTPDPEVLEVVMAEAHKIAQEVGDPANPISESDIRAASIRAMRVAEKAGTPFVANDPEAAQKLRDAFKAQMDMSQSAPFRVVDSQGMVSNANSKGEVGDIAVDHRDAA